MNTFQYTDVFAPDSTAIDRVYYNSKTKDLVVKFVGGLSTGTLYTSVPLYMYKNWSTAPSAGKFYNSDFVRSNRGGHSPYDNFVPESQGQGTSDSPVVKGAHVAVVPVVGDGKNIYEVGFVFNGSERAIEVNADNTDDAVEIVANSIQIAEFITGAAGSDNKVVSVKQYV